MGVTITFLPEQNCEMKMKSSTIQLIKDHLVGIRAGFMLAWLLYSYLIFREDPENRYKVKYFRNFFCWFSSSNLGTILLRLRFQRERVLLRCVGRPHPLCPTFYEQAPSFLGKVAFCPNSDRFLAHRSRLLGDDGNDWYALSQFLAAWPSWCRYINGLPIKR